MLAKGYTSKQMSEALGITPGSVRSWLKREGLPLNRGRRVRNRGRYYKKDNTYVASRPAWERELMRDFLGTVMDLLTNDNKPLARNWMTGYVNKYRELNSLKEVS